MSDLIQPIVTPIEADFEIIDGISKIFSESKKNHYYKNAEHPRFITKQRIINYI